ncbi:MAG: LptF/LptG family permease, partial [Candidatus Omnitrophica bacterium]|nr:LptF/LptG family permease [Candidatus Omnitrophota bacterium]
TSSIACLIAVLFTFTVLNSHNEVIVLRSSGLHFWQITKPAICFALIVSAMIFFINERYVPYAEETAKQIRDKHLMLEADRARKKQARIQNLTFYGTQNRLYFLDSFDPATYEIRGLTIIDYDENQNVRNKTVGLSAEWTGIAWKCTQCHVTEFSQTVDQPTKVRVYQEKFLDVQEDPDDFLSQRLNVNAMNIKQLYGYITRFSNSGAQRAINNLWVDLYQKIAFPWGTLVIVLAGLPLTLMAAGRRRAQTFSSLGLAIGIGFLYYVCNAVGLALGKGGLFPPLLAAWLAPLVFLGLALWLVKWKFG